MGRVNGIASDPPIKYPQWSLNGVVYSMKQGGASTYLLGEYGVTPEQLAAAKPGTLVLGNFMVKLAASMMGTVGRDGRWRPAKVDPLELADSLETKQDWMDLEQAVSEASEKAPAAATAAPALPQEPTPGPMPN